jgi:PAS domain S-box-containing protein
MSAIEYRASQVEVRHLKTLYQLLAAMTRSKNLEEAYAAALTSLLDATAADRAAILTFDEQGIMQFRAWRGLSRQYREAVTGHTPWEKGAQEAAPIAIPDVHFAPDLADHRHTLQVEGIRALAFIPLSLEKGVFGKFMLYYPEPHQFTEEELSLAQAIAGHVALATEHKRSEAARQEGEQRLQAILDNSAAVIFIKDPQGRYVLVNRQFEELFHVSQSKIEGKTDYEVFPKDVADTLRENDRKVLVSSTSLTFEEQAPLPDGVHTYLSIKFPLKGPGGAVGGVCGIATDITDRKQLEMASIYLAAIVECSDDAIISKDLNGCIISWNKGAERILGYSASEVIGKPISMLAPPERVDEMKKILGRIRLGERVHHFETQRRRKDGEIIDVSITASPIRNAAGEIIGASKIARDITERKRREEERSMLLAREQEARKTAELLIQIGPQLATQLDSEKLAQTATDIATVLTGAEFGAFFRNVVNQQGESYVLYTISGVPPESFSRFPMPRNTDLFGPTFRGESVIRIDDVLRDPRYGTDEPYYWMPKGHLPVRSYLAVPVVSLSGAVLGGLFFGHSTPGKFVETHEAIVKGIAAQAAIALDNSRLFEQSQSTQAELKVSNDELRRVNQDLETFAYSASHDLQEPLRNIAISAQLLERSFGQHMDAESLPFLTNIRTSARRMGDLITDILAFTSLSKGNEESCQRVDAGAVLKRVLEDLQSQIAGSGAVVTADELPTVYIDESRLAQLFLNLISNALKYQNEEAPRVHVTAEVGDEWSVFSVIDNGIGIDMRYSQQIFGVFKRLHGREKYPGSGVGLAICHRIVEQYGGRIWLEKSTLGAGSTFCFTVPVKRP